mmetsp:Transcript_8643/g.39266  ORF Transcript_8643/g.39266 Transcript_8643/m.39266 type:complete len:299 (-) Transcript_8643:161-1057(-)
MYPMAVIGGHLGSDPSFTSPNERASTIASTSQLRKNATECRSTPGVFGARTLCGADLYRPSVQRRSMSPTLASMAPGTASAGIQIGAAPSPSSPSPSSPFCPFRPYAQTSKPPTSSWMRSVSAPQSVCAPHPARSPTYGSIAPSFFQAGYRSRRSLVNGSSMSFSKRSGSRPSATAKPRMSAAETTRQSAWYRVTASSNPSRPTGHWASSLPPLPVMLPAMYDSFWSPPLSPSTPSPSSSISPSRPSSSFCAPDGSYPAPSPPLARRDIFVASGSANSRFEARNAPSIESSPTPWPIT